MKYSRVLAAVGSEPWAIYGPKMQEILDVLSFRASGGVFSADEIRARIGGGGAPALERRTGSVAVLPLRGVIAGRIGSMEESSGGVSCEAVGRMSQTAMADPSIGAVVFDIDSPGGMTAGLRELSDLIYGARGQKPIIAHGNALVASAAYWVACNCDELVSAPSGRWGSVGVFAVHQEISKMLEDSGIATSVISAGKYKTELLPYAPLSDEARAFMQARVDADYALFVETIARGRGVSAAAVRDGFGEGRVLDAEQSLSSGMIDRIETLDGTIARLLGGGAPGAMSGALAGTRADAGSDLELRLRAAQL